MKKPNPTSGMRHVALYVENLSRVEQFYTGLLGMAVEWRPDEGNVYLTSGNDNLALHQAREPLAPQSEQVLDHLGFILDTPADVDDWYAFLDAHKVEMRTQPKTHRDGARSFYCYDPAGNTVQMIFHPPISRKSND